VAKTKTQVEATAKAPALPQMERKPELPEKQASPRPIMRSAMLSGGAADPIGGAPNRARAMQGMQQGLGNARISRMASSPHLIQRQKCACGNEAGPSGECENCRQKRLAVQRQVDATGRNSHNGLPESVNLALQSSGGQPLEQNIRDSMEQSFGADFSDVRIHTGSQAARAAQDINAKAFTTGQNIYFGAGQHQPGTRDGQKLLAHELTHTIHQSSSQIGVQTISRVSQPDEPLEREADNIADHVVTEQPVYSNIVSPRETGLQRQDAGSSTAPDTLDAGVAGQTRQHKGETVSSNQEQCYKLLKRMYAREGGKVTRDFVASFYLNVVLPRRPSAGVSTDPELNRDEAILSTLQEQLRKITEEADAFRCRFAVQAMENTRKVLENNRVEVEKEAIRYGLTTEKIQEIKHRFGPEKEHWEEVVESTKYGMDTESGSSKGLAAAAKILLERRKPIVEKQREQRAHLCDETEVSCDFDGCGNVCVPGQEFYQIGQEIDKLEKEYDMLRSGLITEYPMLTPLSEDKRDTSKLETIVKHGPSQQVADLIGQEVTRKLNSIEKVRKGLDGGDVDVWRLPRVIGLTSAQLGVVDNSFEAKIISEEEQSHQPGIFKELMLLAINLLAMITAPMTGGLSLVVAAGVNAVAAAYNVQEYIMKDAMRHSALDVAKALSAEEPSLFWLAVDIAGVFMDVGGSAAAVTKAFRAIGPAAKTAMAVKEGEEAVKMLDELRAIVKKELKDAAKAEAIVGKVERLRKGGSALEAVGATSKEIKALEAAAGVGDELVKDSIGVAKAGAGEVKISKAGHIFSCSSPCSMFREKYAEALARDPNLKKELAALEQRAQAAAKATGQEGSKLRQAAAEAAVELEGRLKISKIQATLEQLVAKYPILAEHKLDAGALQRVLAKADNIDHAKGQLLEEFAAKRMEKLLTSKDEITKLLGKEVNAKLEFIPGHTITDKAGKQFTDGMIVFRQKDGTLRVVGIIESKAGRASSRGLGKSYKSLKDMNPEEFKEAQEVAIELLRDKRPKLANLSNEQLLKNHGKEVEKLMKDLPSAEAGQVRKDIERLVPNVDDKTTTVMINGKPEQVVGGQRSTRILGVAPSDVNLDTLASKLSDDKLNFGRLDVDIDQKQVKALAEDIIQIGKAK
jgi:hypothetical protein